MPIALSTLLLHVQSDTRDAEAGLGRVGEGMRHIERNAAITSVSMTGGMGLIGAAVTGVVGTIKSWVNAAAEGQNQQAAINAVLTSTHGAAGMTAESLAKLARQTQMLTGIDDDAVATTEKMLLTFTNIGKDAFPLATQAVTNLATSMNGGAIPSAQSLQQTAIQVGKALNDPIKGITALQRVGVSFTEQQKEQIKTMMAHNDVLGAQQIILKELNTEFGGAAAAAGRTYEGSLARVTGALENMKKTMGGAVLPILGDFLNMLAPVAFSLGTLLEEYIVPIADALEKRFSAGLKAVSSAFQLVTPTILQVVYAIGNFAQAVGGGIKAAVSDVVEPIGRLRDNIQKTASPLETLGKHFDAFMKVLHGLDWQKISSDVANFGNTIGTQLGSLISGALSQFQAIWRDISPYIRQAGPPLQAFGAALGQLAPIFPQIFQALTPMSTLFRQLLPTLAPLIPLMAGFAADMAQILVPAVKTLVPVILELTNTLGQLFAPIIGIVVGLIQRLVPVFEEVFGTVIQTAVPIIQLLAKLFEEQLVPVFKKFIPVIQDIANKVGDWIGQLGGILIPLIKDVGAILMAVLPPIFQHIGDVLNFLLGVFQFVWPTIQAIVQGALNIIKAVIQTVTDAVKGNWGAVWNDILNIIKTVWDSIWNVIGTALHSILDFLGGIKDKIVDALLSPFRIAKDALGGILGALGKLAIDALNTYVIDGINGLINRISGALDWIASHLGAGHPLAAYENGALIPHISAPGSTNAPTNISGGFEIGHAEGGWLTEPVIGIGLQSGRVHTFAERGPEYIVPNDRVLNGPQPAAVGHTFNLYGPDPMSQARAVLGEIRWRDRIRNG